MSNSNYNAQNFNIWLLLGPELGLKKQEIDKITKKIRSTIPDNSELECIKLYASDSDVESIVFEIQTSSLFSTNRLLQIEQIDTWSAQDTKKIAEALKKKDKDTSIIMVSDVSKTGATIDKLIPKSNKKIFWELTESDYISYVMEKTQTMGIIMNPDAIELLIYLSGDNTLEIDAMLLQIATFREAEKNSVGQDLDNDTNLNETYITREDIDMWISHHKQESIFKLFDELSKREYSKVMSILFSLFRSGEHSAQIMAGLIYQIKNLVRIVQGQEKGISISSMFQSLYIRNYATQNQYKRIVSFCTLDSAQMLLRICVETEEELRSGGDSHIQEIQMSSMLYRMIRILEDSSYRPFTRKSKSHYNISNVYLYDW